MMRWLRGWLYSDDEPVKVAAGFSEPEALMWKELLENNGVPAMVKNMNFLSAIRELGSTPIDFDLFVRRQDVERAREILKSTSEEHASEPDS